MGFLIGGVYNLNMRLTKEEEQTIKTYDAIASEWSREHFTENFWGQEMARFGQLLPRGKVLEIGAGGGRDAKELIAKGYDYVGTDASLGLLQEAKKVNPNAIFLHQSVYELDFPDSSFDGFWASAVLLHIPKDRINEALARLHAVVKNDGIGFVSIKKGEGQRFEEDGVNGKTKRLFVYWQDGEFKAVLKRNNFEVVESQVRPMSEKTTWLVYFVKVKK